MERGRSKPGSCGYISVRITRKQAEAVKSVYQRGTDMAYTAFRRQLSRTIGCDGAVALPWCGMWLCIETDGYIHS